MVEAAAQYRRSMSFIVQRSTMNVCVDSSCHSADNCNAQAGKFPG